jgi:hypothetical protein
MAIAYDYFTYTLPRGRAGWTEFVSYVRDIIAPARSDGIELLGLFSPQLGFSSNEAVVLVRRASASLPSVLLEPANARLTTHDRLHPTVRPGDNDGLKQGGIYVHRWFCVDGERVDDFVELSNRAWSGFEGAYDTEIFGLFRVEPDKTDLAEGAARLLLLTWYKNHAVWEASREQAHDTKSLFAQRHQLTRTTIGKSSARAL